MSSLTVSQSTKPQRSLWQELLAKWPIFQFIGAGLIGLVATWTTLQVSQTSQAAETKHNVERIEKLEKEAVSRELFDERTLRILDEQKKLGDRFDKLLEKK